MTSGMTYSSYSISQVTYLVVMSSDHCRIALIQLDLIYEMGAR